MPNELRRKLLTDYAVALVAERESWERLRDPDLDEVDRCRMFGQWKQHAACLKQLARRLREAEPAVSQPDGVAHARQAANADSHAFLSEPPNPQGVLPVPASSTAMATPRPRQVLDARWLAGGLRLVTAWCARLETAMPRFG